MLMMPKITPNPDMKPSQEGNDGRLFLLKEKRVKLT